MPSLTDVFVAILPDTTQFGRQLTAQLRRIDASSDGKRVGQGFSSGVTGSFKGIAAGLAGAFAAMGAVSLFKGFIADASEAAKITRITENTIQSMGNVANVSAGDITKLAGSIASKTGIDDAAIQSGANLLLTFGNVRDEVGKGNDVFTQATRLGVDMSVALGTDASGAALQLGKALNDPVKGIGALSRAGVSFTAQQKEQIKTLVASGDTLGAQKIILGELEKQFGGTAAAAADPMARLSYVVGELGESVGTLLLPAVSAFATFAGEKVVPAIQGMIDGFSSGEGAAGKFVDIFGRVKAAAQGLFDLLIKGDFTGAFYKAFGVAEDAPIVGFLLDLRQKAIDAFNEVKDGIRGFVEAFRSGGEEVTRSGFAGGLEQVGIFARDAFDYIKSDVIPAALAVGRTLREVGQGALPIAVAAFKGLFDSLTGVFNFVKANDTVFSSLAAGLVAGYVAFKIFTAVTNAFKVAQVAAMVVTTAYKAVLQAYALWTYTATGSTTAFAFAMNVLKVAFLTNPIGIVVIGLIALGAALFVAYKKSETFRDIVNSVWAAIKGSVGGVVDWFTGTVLPALSGVWRGISSKAMELRDTLAAAWRGISAGFGVVMGAFGAVYSTVVAPVFAAFKAAALSLWRGVQVAWGGIAAAFGAAMSGLRAVYTTVVAPVFSLFGAAARLLGDGVGAVWGGIRAGFAVAMSGFGGVYQSLVAPVLTAFKAAAAALWHGLQAAWDGIRVGFRAAMSGFMAVYDNVIAPVFGAFKAAAQFLWDGVEKVWVGIRVGFAAAMVGFRAVYDNLIAPVFGAFKAAAGLLWEGVKFFWQAIKTDFALAMAGIGIVYDRIIEPVFAAFGTAAQSLWRVLQPVWAGIGAGFALALRGFGAVYDSVVAPVFAAFLAGARALGVGVRVAWDGLRSAFAVAMSGFGAVYNTVVAPVFVAFKAGALGLWTGVQLAWDGIRAGFSAAMTGFRAVYQTLIAPVFVLFRAAAQVLWDAVTLVWEGIRAGFDLSMQGIRAVYQGAMVPVFNAYKAAAQVLWRAAEAAWEGIRAAFDLSMKAVRAVYDSVVAPLFKAFRVAAQVLWDGVRAIWDGMRASFDAVSRGIRAVYDGIIVPMFNAFKTAAQVLWTGVQTIWNGIKSGFDTAMRGLKTVYDTIVKPLLGTFETGVDRMRVIFDSVVTAIGKTWDTLKDKMKAPIKVAFDWVNTNVIATMNKVLGKFPGGISIPSLPTLAKGGPVKGPGGPTEDKVLARLSAGEFVVNAAAAKKFRPLLETLNKGTIRDESLVSSFTKRTSLSESSSVSRVRDDGSIVVGAGTAKKHRNLLGDVNAGRAPTGLLPGDEIGGPSWGGAWDAATGFAKDMFAKGARKAAELLLNPLKDRLFALIGSPTNVAAAVARAGLEKLFAAILAKGDEKDKEMAAAQKAGSVGGGAGTYAYPGGGSQANLVAFGRLIQSMGGRAGEHPLFGGVNPVHTRGSNHYVGKAIDLNYGPGGENNTEKAFFDSIVARGLPRQYGLRYIWRSKGHFNHMHVDYDKGGYLQPGAMGVNRGPRPERILTSAQTESFDRLVKVLERGQPSTASGSSSFNFNVYNPIAEPTSVTTNKALQRAADLALV